MSQKPALDDEWDTPGEAVHAVRELIEREEFSQALDLVYVARDEFPRNRPLALLAAKTEQEHGDDLGLRIENWDICIRLHGRQSRPVWFRHLIKAVREEFGQSRLSTRPQEQMEALDNIIELGEFFWPLDEEQELESDAPVDSDTEVLLKLRVAQLRFLIRSLYGRFEYAKASALENQLFRLPVRLLSARDFTTALLARDVDRAELASLTREAIMSLAEKAFPVSQLASTDESPEGKHRKRECEHFQLFKAADMVSLGQFGPASEILDALQPDSSFNPEDSFFQTLTDTRTALQPTGVQAALPDLQAYEGLDVFDTSILLARNANPNGKVVLVFSGGGRHFGMVAAAFHKILKARGCHVIYVMDSHAKHFFVGKEWQTPSELHAKLETIIEDLHGKELYTIGWSSGGGAAMRLGKALGAHGVLAFSPVIVDANSEFAATRATYREAARNDPEYPIDIPTMYDSEGSPNPKTVVYIGDGADQDRRFVAQISDLDDITIGYLPGLKTHSSVKYALGHKMVPDMIATLLESKP